MSLPRHLPRSLLPSIVVTLALWGGVLSGCENRSSKSGSASAAPFDSAAVRPELVEEFRKRLGCAKPNVVFLRDKPKHFAEVTEEVLRQQPAPPVASAVASMPVATYFEVTCGDDRCLGAIQKGKGGRARSFICGPNPASCTPDDPVACARVGLDAPPNEDAQEWRKSYLTLACDAGGSGESCLKAAALELFRPSDDGKRSRELHARACARGSDVACAWYQGAAKKSAYRVFGAPEAEFASQEDGLTLSAPRLRTVVIPREASDAAWPERIDLTANVRADGTDKLLAVTARCRAGDGYASFASTRKPAKTSEKTPAVWTLAAAHPAARPAAPCELTVLVSASKATASESRVLGQLCWANDGLSVGACDDALLPKS
ncbi:MAG: hypothetical protein JRI23_08705, partial [Deltaproteobacteria bacterium]|nr:hypothetical protein [Deltaproteobacteria bacterium]MBW2531693.1 hypothetical protein [Deltaproteobacteria bacterium]